MTNLKNIIYYCCKKIYYGDSTDPNEGWLYWRSFEWTISRISDVSDRVWGVYFDGKFGLYSYVDDTNFAVRPCFYLSSDVAYSSGSGTSSDPIHIVV